MKTAKASIMLNVIIILLTVLSACSTNLHVNTNSVKGVDQSTIDIQSAAPTATVVTTDAMSSTIPPANTAYAPGGIPFVSLQASDIRLIRLIEYSDVPPYYPHPYKDIRKSDDIRKNIEVLKRLTVNTQVDSSDIPIGSTNYTIILVWESGDAIRFTLIGDLLLSIDGKLYKIDPLSEKMKTIFKAADSQTKLLPSDAYSWEEISSDLFTIDDWTYYMTPNDKGNEIPCYLARVNGQGICQKVNTLLDGIHMFICQAEDRIMFMGFKNEKSLNEGVIVSVKPDGSDRKTMAADKGIIDSPVWDGKSLYYVGWSKDLAYPRPLYSVDNSLNKMSKAMDIPGVLLTVVKGDVYCLSDDGKSILILPKGEPIANFASPIEYIECISRTFYLHDTIGGRFTWTVEAGVAPIMK